MCPMTCLVGDPECNCYINRCLMSILLYNNIRLGFEDHEISYAFVKVVP